MEDRRSGGHAPFSDDQIHYLEVSRRHSVDRAIRHYRNQSVAGFAILLLGILLALGLQQQDLGTRRDLARSQRHAIVESGRAVAVNSCNARFEDRTQIRGVLVASMSATKRLEAEGIITHERAEDQRAFYTKQLAKLRLPDCRKDAALLTDDPDKPIPHIEPLYPGSPNETTTGG